MYNVVHLRNPQIHIYIYIYFFLGGGAFNLEFDSFDENGLHVVFSISMNLQPMLQGGLRATR